MSLLNWETIIWSHLSSLLLGAVGAVAPLLLGLVGKVFLSRLELIRFARITERFVWMGYRLEHIDKSVHRAWNSLSNPEKIPGAIELRPGRKRNGLLDDKGLLESFCRVYLLAHGSKVVKAHMEKSFRRWQQWRKIVGMCVCSFVILLCLALGTEVKLIVQRKPQDPIGAKLVIVIGFLGGGLIFICDALLQHEYGYYCFDLFSSVADVLRQEQNHEEMQELAVPD